MDSFVAVVAVDGVNDAPFHLSAKFPVSRGYFVTVIPGSGGGFEPFHNDIERVESYKERKKAEEQIKPKYQRHNWTFEIVESNDIAGKALCEFAEKVGANLLILGHSNKFSIDHLLLGSNAVYAAKNAKMSVLVAK